MSDRHTNVTEELAKRAVAADGWRWKLGMRCTTYGRVAMTESDGSVHTYYFAPKDRSREMLPDLSDPATLGCLLALVREKHGADTFTMPRANAWGCFAGAVGWAGKTEAEALVVALEASRRA